MLLLLAMTFSRLVAAEPMELELRLGAAPGLEDVPCQGELRLLGRDHPVSFRVLGHRLRGANFCSQPAAYVRLHLHCGPEDDGATLDGVVMLGDVRRNRVDLFLDSRDGGALRLRRVVPGQAAGTRPWAFSTWKAAAAAWGAALLLAAGLFTRHKRLSP